MKPAHHLNPRLLALVAAGGMLGTGGRSWLSSTIASPGGWPAATFVANVAGSFLLGALLEALLRRGAESHAGRLVRLGVGTGVLGGFTTFSSLAIELERLLADGAAATAAAYAGASLACGMLACLVGVVVAARHHRWRHGGLARHPNGAERDRTAPVGEDEQP